MKLWFIALLGATPSLMACDLCAVYSASEAQGAGKGFYAGVAEQFTDFGTVQMDGNKIADNGQYIHSIISQIFGGYNFNDRVGIQLNVPVIYRAYGDNSMRDSLSGPGDVSLIGNVLLYEKESDDWNFNLTALGGIKFPTGDSSKLNIPDSALPDGIGGHDIALGSGSYDGLLGAGFSTRWKRFFFNGQMQYAIRSRGDFQHEYANDWTWAGGPGIFLALNENYTIAVQASVSGETKGHDTFNDVPDEDSAATVVYLGPIVNFTWSEYFSAHIGADLPVSRDNSGEQVMADYRIHAALTWKF